MRKWIFGAMLGLLTSIAAPTVSLAAVAESDFDRDTGANTYLGGFGEFNWVGTFQGLAPNAGSEAFLSAFFNADGLGLIKDLGGTIDDKPYDVSFYIASYANDPVSFSDFTTLHIGAQGGTTIWTSTPEITLQDTWFLWEGQYRPAVDEVGQPFVFEFQFGPTDIYDVGIDGPIVATIVPVPAAIWLFGCALGVLGRLSSPPPIVSGPRYSRVVRRESRPSVHRRATR
ncbi:MAG: hypothetical protein QNJ73_09460 [Gammaproteobacteria bacterium]|nr:hypothetical protein [Gammaproteobacteria bacterium]